MQQFIQIKNIFIELFSDYRKYFIILFFVLVIDSVVAGAAIIAIIPLTDYLLDPHLLQASKFTNIVISVSKSVGLDIGYWLFGLIFVFLNIISSIVKIYTKYSILKIKYQVLYGILSNILSKIFNSRWEFFSESGHGLILNTINKESSAVGDTLGQLATQFALIVQIIIYILIPFYVNYQITIITLLLLGLFSIPFLFLNNYSHSLGEINTKTSNKMVGIFTESLQSARIILSFAMQNKFKKRYLKALDSYINATIRSQVLNSGVSLIFIPFGMLSIILAVGIFLENNPDFHLAELVAIMYSLIKSAPLIASVLQASISVSGLIPSYNQLSGLEKRASDLAEVEGEEEFHELKYGITFNNVSFSYPLRNKTIVDLNLYIPKGQMTAIVGESGSGKSTVIDIILGLQQPNIGEVLVDGSPILDFKRNSFRSKVGYVPQEPTMFNTSIKNNLLLSKDSASDVEIWRSLRLSNSENFINSLPDGIETIVGNNGVRLSVGQKQRIALARALIRNPEILILDEATSALDTESEMLIQSSIDKLTNNMTILVVAHRLSTIVKSDKIYVMKDGKIAESGTFNDLSKRTGIFYNMLVSQGMMIDTNKEAKS